MNIWSQPLAQAYYQCLEYAITTPFNCSFLLNLALKTRTCVMALLVTAWSEFSPNFIEFPVLYGLMMGSWSWINASIIEVLLGHGHVYEIILEVCSSDTILHVDSTWLFLLHCQVYCTQHYSFAWLCFILYLAVVMGMPYLAFMERN